MANAIDELGIAPVEKSLPDVVAEPVSPEEKRKRDLERLNAAFVGIREAQKIATEYGVRDILQDNGGKVLQMAIILGLTISSRREGNDAYDAEGNEYELKTVNIALKRNPGVTTHHHLTVEILNKYRKVKAWYVGLYEGIELKEIYRLWPEELEVVFGKWENKIITEGVRINNPHIPMPVIKSGTRVYPIDDEPQEQQSGMKFLGK